MPYPSKRQAIGIDVDDVLADFVTAHKKVAFDLFGRPDPSVLPVDWEMSNYGLSEAEHAAVWKRIQSTKNWWLTLGKKPGTDKLPAFLKRGDYIVYFITSRVPTTGWTLERQTAEWLRAAYGIEFPTVVLSDGLSKGKIAQALSLVAFIDDREKNCLDVVHCASKCHTFICTRSHNKELEHDLITRVGNLNDMLEFL